MQLSVSVLYTLVPSILIIQVSLIQSAISTYGIILVPDNLVLITVLEIAAGHW